MLNCPSPLICSIKSLTPLNLQHLQHWRRETGDRKQQDERREKGGRRQETEEGKQRDRRLETEDGRLETGRRETGERRRESVLCTDGKITAILTFQ